MQLSRAPERWRAAKRRARGAAVRAAMAELLGEGHYECGRGNSRGVGGVRGGRSGWEACVEGRGQGEGNLGGVRIACFLGASVCGGLGAGGVWGRVVVCVYPPDQTTSLVVRGFGHAFFCLSVWPAQWDRFAGAWVRVRAAFGDG